MFLMQPQDQLRRALLQACRIEIASQGGYLLQPSLS